MPRNDSAYPADWLRIAEKDLARVELCLAAGDAELAGFCLQQAVEKFLKGYLLGRGWKLRRIHDLAALLDDAVGFDSSLEQFGGLCEEITAFYTLQRYPLTVASGLTETEVRECLANADQFIEKLR